MPDPEPDRYFEIVVEGVHAAGAERGHDEVGIRQGFPAVLDDTDGVILVPQLVEGAQHLRHGLDMFRPWINEADLTAVHAVQQIDIAHQVAHPLRTAAANDRQNHEALRNVSLFADPAKNN